MTEHSVYEINNFEKEQTCKNMPRVKEVYINQDSVSGIIPVSPLSVPNTLNLILQHLL